MALESWANTIESWFAAGQVDEPASIATEDIQQKADQASPGNQQSKFSTPSNDHTADDQFACSRPHSGLRSNTEPNRIYKWVDEQGQTNMSDTPPQGLAASVMDMAGEKQDFTYKIILDGVAIPVNFEGQLVAGSKRMYDIWHFFIGEKNLRRSQIQVLLVGGADRFNAMRARTSPNSKPVRGFYSLKKNQAVVKFNAGNLTQTLGTTFHEISHLITASHLGPTTPWLTEGLAEYFETMQVSGQAAAIHPNRAHVKLLKGTALPSLKAYLSIERPEWHGALRDRNYAIAWSLMHFLLKDTPGMSALKAVMEKAEQNYCKPHSMADALDDAYPGGLAHLERDWRRWLANKEFKTHQL